MKRRLQGYEAGHAPLIVREPDPTDRRVKRPALTADGAKLVSTCADMQAELVASIPEGFASVELQGLQEQMIHVSGRLEGASSHARSGG